jgi:hypothetical protein
MTKPLLFARSPSWHIPFSHSSMRFLSCNGLTQQVRLNCCFQRSPYLVNLMVGWLVGWLVGCFVGWLIGWLVGGLVVVYPTCSATSSTRERGHYSYLSRCAVHKGRRIKTSRTAALSDRNSGSTGSSRNSFRPYRHSVHGS